MSSIVPKSKDSPIYKTLMVQSPKPFVFEVVLNRPDKLNALSDQMWHEIKDAFHHLNNNPDCRSIVLSAAGNIFTSGLDLKDAMKLVQVLADYDDVARKGNILYNKIKSYQVSFMKPTYIVCSI